MTTDTTPNSDPKKTEPVEELAAEAKADNPDSTTARESFELELMEEDRSKEGESVELDDE